MALTHLADATVCLPARAEGELSATQAACRDLREQMELAAADRRSCDMKSAAEIDDLYRTKKNLEERLIELIRYMALPCPRRAAIFPASLLGTHAG